MKKDLLITTLTLIFALMLLCVIPTEAEGAIYDDTVRLHILANSDSAKDQELKLFLRDELLSEYGEALSYNGSAEEARRALAEMLPEIEKFCKDLISKNGSSYSVKAMLSDEWYETREYGDIKLPEGRYTSLRIVIGEGEGQNWWCVMFPPLCLDAALADGVYTDAEDTLINQNYRVKFKLLELASKTFG